MLREEILNRIETEKLKVFSAVDFIELGEYDAIRKALERLRADGTIRRLIQGFYDKPKYNETFSMYEAPNIDDLACAIAKRYGWHICPSGNYALNILGLSTQVPAQYIYISDGPYKTYTVDGTELVFKHATQREITDFSYMTLLVIQAIKKIGKDSIGEYIEQIREKIPKEERSIILDEAKRTSIWLYNVIRKICEVRDV